MRSARRRTSIALRRPVRTRIRLTTMFCALGRPASRPRFGESVASDLQLDVTAALCRHAGTKLLGVRVALPARFLVTCVVANWLPFTTVAL